MITAEEIAKKLCEHTYMKQCEQAEQDGKATFTLEEYWKRNRNYFLERAKIYLEVKECLE